MKAWRVAQFVGKDRSCSSRRQSISQDWRRARIFYNVQERGHMRPLDG
jgi:hypothetical protein